jgi:multidrug efflux pump subunit AcrB
MLQLVKLALSKPYTFVVLAILIVLSGSIAWVRTPTDIFPDIRIPVIAAVWTYRGLPPEDMSGRVVYYYERQLSTTVNDIDHIESQSLNGIGVVKIFFRPGVDIRTATAQVTSVSQTVLKQMPPGITPPLILNYNASTVPILQMALSSKGLSEQKIFDLGQNFIRPSLASVQGAAIPSPMAGANARSRSISTRRRWSRATFPPPTSAWRWRRRTRSCPPGRPRSASTNTISG